MIFHRPNIEYSDVVCLLILFMPEHSYIESSFVQVI